MDTFPVKLNHQGVKRVEYGLTVTDPFTQWRWFHSLQTKDEVANAVIRIVRHAQTQLSCRVKRLYADGGSEFINRTLRDWCSKQGILLHHTPARTQQLNGIAENAVRSNKDDTRTLLVHSEAPMLFWVEAACHATYLWNRTHVSNRTRKTPYEAMYGKKPSARHLGVFGCDAFVHVPKEQRAVLAAKTQPCIYLGHDNVQNCAKVYLLASRKIIASRDVTYMTTFKYCEALRQGGEHGVLFGFGPATGGTEVPLSPSPARSREPSGGSAVARQPPGLEPVPEHPDDGEQQQQQLSDEQYEVDSIVDQRTTRSGTKEYLVRWVGYEDEDSWQTAEQMLADAPQAVQDFERSRGNDANVAPEPVLDGGHDDSVVVNDAESEANEVPALAPVGSSSVPASASPAAPVVAAPASAVQPAPKRRSPRDHLSSRSLDLRDDADADVAHVIEMAMSAIGDVQSSVDSEATHRSDEVLCAVSAGVSLLDERTPNTYREAMASSDADRWTAAMQKEFDGCESKGVWSCVDRASLPKDANILPCKWVYKIKTDGNGVVTEYKARITPKGFRQKEGRDYFEVFAGTGMYKTLRVGLSLAAKFDYEIEQLDIPQAFLNADVEEDVYMAVPEGFGRGREGMVFKLQKSLYGLKQAPRNWRLLVHDFITKEMDYKASVSDPCLYHRRSQSGRLMFLFLFVDDFKGASHIHDRAEWVRIRSLLVDRFQAKVMGEAKYMLGMRITRDRKAGTITLDQELYITKALEKYGFAECRTAPTPEVVGAAHATPTEKQAEPTDKQRYMEIVGTLMYAAISTRPDIVHAVYYLAAHMVDPRRQHMDAAERVLRYLAGTRDLGLVFGSRNESVSDSRGHTQLELDVCAYADADWANDKSDRRSVTGWVAKINGDPISWASKKQRTVALSTCEAELYAEAEAIREVLWLRGLVKELGLRTALGSVVHGDNQSTIAVSKNGIKGERTKHVDVKYHFVTETVERGDVQLKWVASSAQHADIFTKALPVPAFEQLREQLMSC